MTTGTSGGDTPGGPGRRNTDAPTPGPTADGGATPADTQGSPGTGAPATAAPRPKRFTPAPPLKRTTARTPREPTWRTALQPRPRPSRAHRLAPLVLLVPYLPLLLTHPGKIGADTKAYLYLDPVQLLKSAAYLWDPKVAMGTVTHQNIGYLLPMGPWFAAFHAAHVPLWIGQRLWTGTLLFFAGLGVMFLLRTLGWPREHTLVAALAYELSPYLVLYEARTSAILLPWAGLPWMIALVIRAGRRGTWRDPAAFAVVVALIGGTNATSLLFAGLAPVLWLPFAVWGSREISLRRAVSTALRVGILSLGTSVWWIAGLSIQGQYGLNVLKYTETVPAVARTSLPFEILRGLGNWYFYGRDRPSYWVTPARFYTQTPLVIAASFAIPLLALAAAAVVRWRERAYFVILVVVGLVIGVGVHPYSHPTPLGGLFKDFAQGSTAGLALRTTARAVPLLVLGTAVLLGAGINAWLPRLRARRARWRRPDLLVPLACVAIVAAAQPALWTGGLVENSLDRPETVPTYWTDAAASLTAGGDATRVLDLPGADFSYYRWGTTVDPAEPGLTTRPLVGRELTPFGSPASADLVRALDRRLQEGVLEPGTIAPVARLMGAGEVLIRNDLQYERFRTPRPRTIQELFNPTPAGLAPPVGFGPPASAPPAVPTNDEIDLAIPPATAYPPSVETLAVQNPLPIVRAEPAGAPVVVAGDGEGVVEAAGAGLLSAGTPIIYSGSAASDPTLVSDALNAGGALVLTDTNRRRAERWGTVRENYGYTERAGEKPLVQDPSDARLPLFPGATDDAHTVTEQRGVQSVMATAYGDPVAYTAADRPAMALDGDPYTAWTVAAFDDPREEKLTVSLTQPVTTDHVTLLQPLLPPNERFVTRAHLLFDGKDSLPVALDDTSRRLPGQTVRFPTRTFSSVTFVIDDTNYGERADFSGVSGVGLAELQIGDQSPHVDEVVRLPTDLLTLAGPSSLAHPLTVLLARDRSNPAEPYKGDEEQSIVRTFTLPTSRSFALSGEARLSDHAPDQTVDQLRGQPRLPAAPIVVSASSRLPGDLNARAEMAFDGSPDTAWTSSFGDTSAWIEADTRSPVTIDHLDLGVVADGVHSVPTQLLLSVDAAPGAPGRALRLPVIPDRGPNGASVPVHLTFPPVTGTHFRLAVTGLRQVTTINYFSRTPQVTPISFTSVDYGMAVPAPPAAIDTGCRSDLLTVDGRPYPIRITGSTATADAAGPLAVAACGPALDLGPGDHLIRAAEGKLTGINLDRLVLTSAAGGAPAAAGQPTPAAPAATVRVTHDGPTSVTATVSNAPGPFWMVLGQSFNAGWRASLKSAGRTVSLGRSHLVDAYANGWLIHPAPGGGAMTITFTWTPQRRVWVALAISAAILLFCLALAIWLPRHPVRTPPPPPQPEPRSPFTAESPVSPRRAVVAVLGLLVGGAVLGGAGIGVILALATAAALVWRRGRILLTVGAVACVGAVALYVLELQVRYAFPLKLSWPARFQLAAPLGWLAVGLLAADVVADWARPVPS